MRIDMCENVPSNSADQDKGEKSPSPSTAKNAQMLIYQKEISHSEFDSSDCEKETYSICNDIYDDTASVNAEPQVNGSDVLPGDLELSRKSSSDTNSGLVISPIKLTQDLPLSIGTENDSRLSSVLENIETPLVYLPNTRQLVTDCDVNSNDKENSSLNTPDIAIDDIEDSDFICDKFKLVNLQDTSSIGETDSLLRLKDADQFTCNSFELDNHIQRVNTGDSLLRTFNDTSSLSSISTCTDFSVSAVSIGEDGSDGTGMCFDTGDGGFMEVNLHSRNSFERSKNDEIRNKDTKQKRRGISGFLSRNIFSRKSKEEENEDQQGWKLFGRVPPKQGEIKPPQQISCEYQQRTALQAKSRKQDIEVLSTTALILENRPRNLPSKDPEEAERHRQQYEEMVEAAKRKEQKEVKMKKKQKQQQLKQEDLMLSLSKRWAVQILPNWEIMKATRKTQEMWWLGLPTNIRGKVWRLAIGNDLNITPELYEICVGRADDRIRQACELETNSPDNNSPEQPSGNRESSVELIILDISRTFPQLCIFQKGGPYHDLLHSLLGAYVCYRPDVGYVQGMSFIAAVLLLNMDVADAFICFANLLNRPCQVAFFRVDKELMKFYFQTFEEFFQENMPSLFTHFQKNNVTPDIYIIEWIFSLYSKSLPLDIACRVWDIFCRDGEEFLFRTALGILKLYEDVLIHQDFIHLAQFLTKLPENISSDALFKSIELIHMNIDKKRFAQVLASKKEHSRDLT